MVQAGACWECGSTEHHKKDCPKYKAKMAKKDDNASLLQAKLELEQELAKRNEEDDGPDSSSIF